ncbi:hypothetical protein K504DRAFT_447455 [Pleomassaria siparia CBS 279.74]|uniref:Uncharacterized protein n=1 Tax=Pleomassaria siparia CBS 279.74 TaxID=1314801 RepID=A0A6G1K0W0_9PLEO|nr:hypothetical protein K504DRAFT_447455 [Pleomassaria siparia CBS 279.74]
MSLHRKKTLKTGSSIQAEDDEVHSEKSFRSGSRSAHLQESSGALSQESNDPEYASPDEGHSGRSTPSQHPSHLKGYLNDTKASRAKQAEKKEMTLSMTPSLDASLHNIGHLGKTDSHLGSPFRVSHRSSSQVARTPNRYPSQNAYLGNTNTHQPKPTLEGDSNMFYWDEKEDKPMRGFPSKSQSYAGAFKVTVLAQTTESPENENGSPAEAKEFPLASTEKRVETDGQDNPSEVERLKQTLEVYKRRLMEQEETIHSLREQESTPRSTLIKSDNQVVLEMQKKGDQKEQELVAELSRLKKEIGTVNAEHSMVDNQLRTAEKNVRVLETEKAQLQSSIVSSEARLNELKEFKAAIQRLQDEIDDDSQQDMAERSAHMAEYKGQVDEDQNMPNELVRLRSGIRRVIHQYIAKFTEVSQQNTALKLDLARKETDLGNIQARLVKHLSDEVNDGVDRNRDSWRQMYEHVAEEHSRYKGQAEAFKAKAKAAYRPDLERKNRELERRLTEVLDENARLQGRASSLQEDADNWESEFNDLRMRNSQAGAEGELEIERLRQEMNSFIQDYRDKIPDRNPDWWDVETLQIQVKDLQRQLEDQAHDSVEQKEELGIAYREYVKIKAQNDSYRAELGIEADAIQAVSRSNKQRAPNHSSPENSPEQVAKRENLLNIFIAEQERAREKRVPGEELIERARKWKMGKYYPPITYGYKAVKKKSMRQRWEVDEYERLVKAGIITD